jgi:two-component system cell cycle sensor histidine kinase/response regulator CckA
MNEDQRVTLEARAQCAKTDRAQTLEAREGIEGDTMVRLAKFTMDQSADAIFWSVDDGRFEYVNEAACRLLGYSFPELLNLRVWDIYTGLSPETWQARVAHVKKDVIRENSASCRHRDGRLIPVEVTVKYQEAEGKQFMCAYVRDITSRNMLEDQFRQAQKLEAVGRLAGGIAHDFNNLLTVINGYSLLILDRLSPQSPDRSALTEISLAGTRAAALTRQLLAFSRKQVIQPVVLNLNTLIMGLGKMLTRLLGEDIEVNVRTDRELGKIKADPGQIEQILMNLSVNARDAMPGGGKLTIETLNVDLGPEHSEAHLNLPTGRYVMLTISDTGCGMDKNIQSHLFEPFFTTKEVGKGTGLGLSTVYGIVTRAGGRISCQSALGKGTTFVLFFPRCEDGEEASDMEPHGRSGRGSETILLVEDDHTVRTLARVVLERYGYKVLEACDGQEALKRVLHHPSNVDLMVTDMVMPGMNGLQLIDEFSPRNPDANILIMSGYSQTGLTDTEIRRRGLSYIQKPFLPEALGAKVREILDRRASRKTTVHP